MTKYITVKLTEDQAKEVIEALQAWKAFGMMGNEPIVDEHKAFNQRIITKVTKALGLIYYGTGVEYPKTK